MTQYSLAPIEGDKTELGRLLTGEVLIGREPPDDGITVPSEAVSRTHGRFLSFKSHWLYQDLGSTNGSWLNGIKLAQDSWRVIRIGDVLQMADFAIEVTPYARSSSETMAEFPSLGPRSILVAYNNTFSDEFKISEYGRALAIGGTGADLELEGDLAELPSLVVERRGNKTVVFGLSKDLPKYINGKQFVDTTTVVDGDEISIGNFLLLINDPSSKTSLQAAVKLSAGVADPDSPTPEAGPVSPTGWERPQGGETLTERGYHTKQAPDLEPRSTIRLPFGRGIESEPDTAETVAIDVARGLTNELGPRRGHGEMAPGFAREDDNESSWASLEDRIVLVVGLTLLVMLMLLVVWWIFL